MVTRSVLLILSFTIFTNQCCRVIGKIHYSKDDTSGLIVDTNVGSIRGLKADDGDYALFMGIPYAEVDRDNVFGPAIPHPRFENTFEAYDDSAACPQIDELNQKVIGSLDCLHLNIYVPNSASAEKPVPVLVYIYGGGFYTGSAGRFLYGPKYLVRHDTVLVTMNYRIGPYGFMCLDTPDVIGNQGLKDQVIALKWIKENIAAFGGDDTKITISGNSAGGISADFHVYYGKEDLFSKIISQSGVALSTSLIWDTDLRAPYKLAQHLNYSATDLKDALSYLNTVNVHEVIAAANEIGVIFGPCVERKLNDADNYIAEHPLHMEIPRVKDIEVLIGFTNDEMYSVFSSMPDIAFQIVDFVENAINSGFDFEDNDELFSEMKEIVTHFYYGDEKITANLRQQVTNMVSDFAFNFGTLRTVKKYLDNGVQTLYLYLFSYSGERNLAKHRANISSGGAAHTDELGYLFDVSYMEKPLNVEDELIVNRMTELWANFVKYGNPTTKLTSLVPVQWPPVTQDKWYYLELDTELRVSTRPLHHRMAFLDLFYKMNERHQKGYNLARSSARYFKDIRKRHLKSGKYIGCQMYGKAGLVYTKDFSTLYVDVLRLFL